MRIKPIRMGLITEASLKFLQKYSEVSTEANSEVSTEANSEVSTEAILKFLQERELQLIQRRIRQRSRYLVYFHF